MDDADKVMARVRRESSRHVRSARESVAQTTEHIRQSRHTIERSLRLLAQTPRRS